MGEPNDQRKASISIAAIVVPIVAMLLTGLSSLVLRLAQDGLRSEIEGAADRITRLEMELDGWVREGMLGGARQRFEEQTRIDTRQDAELQRIDGDLETHLRSGNGQ